MTAPRPDPAAAAGGLLARLDMTAMVMGLVFVVIWSSAFSAAKFVVADAPPLLSLALRFAVSGAIAVGLALAAGQSFRFTRRQWGLVVVFGICQNSLYLGLNYIAMTRIEGGFAAIIASMLPMFVAAGAWGFLGDRPGRIGALGLGLGFAGVALIMGARIEGGADGLGVALCLVGALALAVATLVVRGVSPGSNLMMVVGMQMLVGAVTLAPVAALLESPWEINWTTSLIAAFAYTVIFPGLVATMVWFHLVRRIGPTNAAAFHFLNPCLGVGIAALTLGEALEPRDLIGVAIVTVGILLVQLARRPAPDAGPAQKS